MPVNLMILGAVFFVAALIGGALKAGGVELPLLKSGGVRIVLGIFGLGLLAAGFYLARLVPASAPQVAPDATGGVAANGAASQSASAKSIDCNVKTTGANSPAVCGNTVGGDINIGEASK